MDKRHSWDECSVARVLLGASQPTGWSLWWDMQRHRMLVADIGTFREVRILTKSPVVSEE